MTPPASCGGVGALVIIPPNFLAYWNPFALNTHNSLRRISVQAGSGMVGDAVRPS